MIRSIDAHEVPADARPDKSVEARRLARQLEDKIAEEIARPKVRPKADVSIGEECISAKIMADAKDTETGSLEHLRLVFQAAVEDRTWANIHLYGMSPDEARRRAEDATRAEFAATDDFRKH